MIYHAQLIHCIPRGVHQENEGSCLNLTLFFYSFFTDRSFKKQLRKKKKKETTQLGVESQVLGDRQMYLCI